MSYSRTYRCSNGVDINQTNMDARQRAGEEARPEKEAMEVNC